MHLHQRVQFIIHHNIGATNVVINAFFFRCFELYCVFVKFALDPIDYLEMIVVICVYIIPNNLIGILRMETKGLL